MRLLLHVGAPKTGTTSIQTSLHAAAPMLLRHGILYPCVEGSVSHNLLSVLVKPRREWSREYISPDRNVMLEAEALWESVAAQCHDSTADVTILSGEYLFGLRERELLALKRRFEAVFNSMSVVVYLRDPASRYLSVLQQIVKGSASIPSPSDYAFAMRGALAAVGKVFDGEVAVRAFDRQRLTDGCVVTDLLSKIPGRESLRIDVTTRNESMSAEAACVMQRLHELVIPGAKFVTPLARRVLRALRATGQDHTKARLAPGIAALLERNAITEVRWIESTFGIQFPRVSEAVPEQEPSGWRSHALPEILDVRQEAVEQALYRTLRHLAAQAETQTHARPQRHPAGTRG